MSGDLERYTTPRAIWRALGIVYEGMAIVRLVKMSWLISYAKTKKPLPRRQEMPSDAFITVSALKKLHDKCKDQRVLPIITISYCWLTCAHPDPKANHLQTVAKVLERKAKMYRQNGFEEMGVFWDWLSLFQKNPALWAPCVLQADAELNSADRKICDQYHASRTEAESKTMHYALSKTMDLWYAHQGTTVYLLSVLPPGSTRTVTYDQSGWTTFERCSAEQIKQFELVPRWCMVLDLATTGNEGQSRRWPVGPDDFVSLISSCIFTNGADREVVTDLYRQTSERQLGGVTELSLSRMPTPASVTDAQRFAGCLRLCQRLTTLELSGSIVRDVTLLSEKPGKALFDSLRPSDAPLLVHLNLEKKSSSRGWHMRIGSQARCRPVPSSRIPEPRTELDSKGWIYCGRRLSALERRRPKPSTSRPELQQWRGSRPTSIG